MGLIDHLDQRTSTTIALVLLIAALCLFLLLCILSVFLCRQGRYGWSGESSVWSQPDDSSCMNDAFDITDETTPRRIEQRRFARQRALFCEDPRADVPAKSFDRSVGNALAVEQLLRDSYVFDTNILPKPDGDVTVIAAKRDYL